jgi:two-component system sensor histidine kinase ChvG
LTVTIVLSLFLSWTISAPLGRLTKIAERIAAGDRSADPKLNRRDEIGQLSRAIDIMARNLDSRASYVKELAANISHEFKSPLTSIRGAAELLIDGAAEDPTAREKFLNNILTDAHRLDRLVSRLLELSRFEADLAPTEVFDYEALVREVADHSSGDIPVSVDYLARTTHIRARRSHLLSALSNLIDNAQQHASPDSVIKVSVIDVGSRSIRTSVHNFGPAIHEANLPRIWDRFFTTRGSSGGTGLGLPIVKAVIAAHAGSTDVVSTEGLGTTFSFDLPKLKID